MYSKLCEQFYRPWDKGFFKAVSVAPREQQRVTKQAPLVADHSVQRVAGIVHNVQQLLQCHLFDHCHQRIQLARLISLSSLEESLFDTLLPPTHHSIRQSRCYHW